MRAPLLTTPAGGVRPADRLVFSVGPTQPDSPTPGGVGGTTKEAAWTAKVKTAIASDAGLGTATAIDVTTYRGVVQLSGFVDNADKIERAAAAARSVKGVRSLENNIQVKPRS